MRKLAYLFVAVCVSVSPALAVDYWGGPPEGEWTRGEPGSTWQNWHLCVPNTPDNPDEGNNPYAIDTPPLFEPVEGEWEWRNDWEGPEELGGFGIDGWHCISAAGGRVAVTIANRPEPNEIKKIFIQLTSSKGPSGVTVAGNGPDGPYAPGIFPTGKPHIQWPGPAPFGGSWYTYNYGLTLQPNPESETIFIDVVECTVIDQIVVDTICTPEPGSVVLIGLGGLVTLIRRRRRTA